MLAGRTGYMKRLRKPATNSRDKLHDKTPPYFVKKPRVDTQGRKPKLTAGKCYQALCKCNVSTDIVGGKTGGGIICKSFC